jgi:hypothetical protein
MVGDSDAKLTGGAAEILRQAVEGFDHDADEWPVGDNAAFAAQTASLVAVGGSFPGLTGSFVAATGSLQALTGSLQALTGSLQAIGNGSSANANAGASLKKAFKLPGKLPATRLPSSAQLATMARSARLMAELQSLAGWLGREGRLVTADNELSDADAADAVMWLGIQPQYLPYLLDYALTSRWLVLDDEPDSNRTWVVLGETAWRWADGDDSGALHVWATVFAALLARTLDVAASMDPPASRKLKFQGQGVATAVRLFRARGAGLSVADVRGLVMSGAIGDRPSSRVRRAWDGWVRGHGEPANWLLRELAALGAVSTTDADDAAVELTPLAVWALREQLRLDGIEIPLLKTASAQMTAAALVAFVDSLSDAEGEAEFASWVGARGPDRAARELLAFAAFSGPQPRLATVKLVRRIGAAAHPAWRDAMQRPELRGYARITLADLAEGTMPPVPDPDPDDLTRVAADLLALACGHQVPDPEDIARQFSEAVPEGEESWIFGLMSLSSHPDVAQVLKVLGNYHPDPRIGKDARRAARSAARRARMAARGDRALARASGR